MNNVSRLLRLAACACVPLSACLLAAQPAPEFTGIERLTNREMLLRFSAPTGMSYRIDASTNLPDWTSLLTFASTGANLHADSAAPYHTARFYRALQLTGSNFLRGDHLETDQGDIVFQPINHASFVLSWNGKMIYNDPVGGATPYAGLPRADLILVSHSHSDHYSSSTLDAVRGNNTVIIAPQAVFNALSTTLRTFTIVLTNGASTNVMGMGIEAVPAYNANHTRGTGNGYVVTLGGRRLYMSGDTGDIPETRALRDIDVAFLCMNIPFTMTVTQAVSVVREFQPKVVYPYHFRNQDLSLGDLNYFKQQVGTDRGVEVRVRKWY